MNTCPNCGKMAGLHGSILQGCMCQYSMQAPPQRTWVGLTDDEVVSLKMLGRDLEFVSMTALRRFARDIEQTLKEKNI